MGFVGLTQRRVLRRDTSLKTVFCQESVIFTTYGLRGWHTAPRSAARHLPENCLFGGKAAKVTYFEGIRPRELGLEISRRGVQFLGP